MQNSPVMPKPLHCELRSKVNSMQSNPFNLKRSIGAMKTWADDKDFLSITSDYPNIKAIIADMQSNVSEMNAFISKVKHLQDR